MKNLYYVLISFLLISCGGSDSDDSSVQETTSQKFLEKYNNQVFELNMAAYDYTDYVVFYNNTNGLFFKFVEDELPYGYSCLEFSAGETNFDGDIAEVTITQHNAGSILFRVTQNSLTILEVEVYEAYGSNSNLQYLNIKFIQDDGESVTYAYSEVSGIDINTLCN